MVSMDMMLSVVAVHRVGRCSPNRSWVGMVARARRPGPNVYIFEDSTVIRKCQTLWEGQYKCCTYGIYGILGGIFSVNGVLRGVLEVSEAGIEQGGSSVAFCGALGTDLDEERGNLFGGTSEGIR